ncbi:hypothetical protein D3C71_1763150 [compost metagenome]
MTALDNQPRQPFRLLTGMNHRNAAAKGVPHQPVVKYVVTNQRIGQQLAHVAEPRDGNIL